MKGLEPTGTSEQKYTKPYFHSDEPLKLPPSLPDVTEDAKKSIAAVAEAFMKPLTVEVEIPSRLVDNHFGEEIFADPVSTEAGETYEREPKKKADTNKFLQTTSTLGLNG